LRDTAGGCVPGRQVILLLLENMDFVSTCILKLFYMLPSLLILALFIVDPDAIIAKGEDLLKFRGNSTVDYAHKSASSKSVRTLRNECSY